MKIKKELIRNQDDIYLACVYMNPHKNNKDDAKKFEVLQDEIMQFQQKSPIIFQGDLNKRTGKRKITY